MAPAAAAPPAELASLLFGDDASDAGSDATPVAAAAAGDALAAAQAALRDEQMRSQALLFALEGAAAPPATADAAAQACCVAEVEPAAAAEAEARAAALAAELAELQALNGKLLTKVESQAAALQPGKLVPVEEARHAVVRAKEAAAEQLTVRLLSSTAALSRSKLQSRENVLERASVQLERAPVSSASAHL